MDGLLLGEKDGNLEGRNLAANGVLVGRYVGSFVGLFVGDMVGFFVGKLEGMSVVGKRVGPVGRNVVGIRVGRTVGS